MAEMSTHERVARMYAHQEADRIPITDSPWKTTIERWQREGMPEDVHYVDYFELDRFARFGVDNSPRFPEEVVEETEQYVVQTTRWGATLRNWKHITSTPEWLDFRVNGRHMGAEFALGGGAPEITFREVGTDEIVFLEVVKLDLATKKFQRLGVMQPDSDDVQGKFWDKEFTGDSMYYVRLKQKSLVRGREVWAWPSPVWVKR